MLSKGLAKTGKLQRLKRSQFQRSKAKARTTKNPHEVEPLGVQDSIIEDIIQEIVDNREGPRRS